MPDAGGGIDLSQGVPDWRDMQELTSTARFQSLLGANQAQLLAQGGPPVDPGQAKLPVAGQAGGPLPPGMAPPVQGASAAGAAGEAVHARPASAAPQVAAAAGHADQTRAAGAQPGGAAPEVTRGGDATPVASAQPASPHANVTAAPPPSVPAGAGHAAAAAPAPAHAPAGAQDWSPGQAAEAAHRTMPVPAAAPAAPRLAAQPVTQQPEDPLQTVGRATWHAPSHPAAGWLALAGATALLPPLPPVRAEPPRHFQPLRAYRQPPQPELYWAQLPVPPRRRVLAYTDLRPVPLDLAPYTPALACWRLDDTEALILTSDPREGGGAAALHALLMDHAAPVTLLRPGQGFATWEGSPLWLRLAGIAKPPALGVLLAESAPARLQVMRQADSLELTWLRDGVVVQTRRLEVDAAFPARIWGGAALPARRAAAIAGARGLPEPRRWRVQEALAAAARVECWLAADSAARDGWAALAARGRTVLAHVLQGAVHGIGAMDGIALAVALDRLPADQTIGVLAC